MGDADAATVHVPASPASRRWATPTRQGDPSRTRQRAVVGEEAEAAKEARKQRQAGAAAVCDDTEATRAARARHHAGAAAMCDDA